MLKFIIMFPVYLLFLVRSHFVKSRCSLILKMIYLAILNYTENVLIPLSVNVKLFELRKATWKT